VCIPNLDASGERNECAEHHRNDTRRERRVDGDDEAREVLTFLDRLDGFRSERSAALGVGEELLSRGGQHRAARGALEHLGTDDALEVADAITDGGLGDDQRGSGAPEAAGADDGEEHLEIPNVESHKQILWGCPITLWVPPSRIHRQAGAMNTSAMDSPAMNSPTRLIDHVVHLTDALGITVSPLNDELWAARDRTELATGRLVSVFAYDATWDYQERHPTGDELVYLIAGEVDLLVDSGAGEHALRLSADCAGVVPAGGWHRLAVHEPCTVLFITPTPARTEHRPAIGGR
jgi:hypothetical protein